MAVSSVNKNRNFLAGRSTRIVNNETGLGFSCSGNKEKLGLQNTHEVGKGSAMEEKRVVCFEVDQKEEKSEK